MDRSLSQALTDLIPSLIGPLPLELIELAISLLAQSRSKASSLKADEEIARSYACANIACERLKQTLALPKIQPRPPCPPKVYQKLYRYLDNALPTGTRKSARAKRSTDPGSTPTSSPAKPKTPVKEAHVRPDIPRRKTPLRKVATNTEVPKWLMPAIRQLCKRMSAPAAPHHIFAGVSSIMLSRETSQATDLKVAALVVAVYLLVTTRLKGVKVQPAEYARQKSLALSILKEEAEEDHERNDVDDADVDACTKQFRDCEWTQMDWFGNVPVGAGVGTDDGPDEHLDSDSNDGIEEEQLLPIKRKEAGRLDSINQGYLEPGLGTMMQDRVDYISDERRSEYKDWAKNILVRIDALEKSDEMNDEAG